MKNAVPHVIIIKMHFYWNVMLFQVSNKNTWNLDFLKEQTPLNFVNFCML